MISFDRVSKRYEQGHEALREVSVNIGSDELVFITGHSGAGKTTLLRMIMLMERPSRGQVIIDGQNLAAIGPPRHSPPSPQYRCGIPEPPAADG